MTIEHRDGSKWVESYQMVNCSEVYRSLASDLYRKKVLGSHGIKSVRHRDNFDGTQTITTDFGNGTRRVYVVDL